MEHPVLVRRWLWGGAALCAAMVLVGGITRLTGSGLSITEWRVVTGAVPPLSAAAWDEQWRLYQLSPQYQKENAHFGLDDFKRIFFWEWFHRLLGRVTGLWYLLPWLYFWRRRRLEPWLAARGGLLFGLVLGQGVLGWLMVQSGLVDQPRVSHFRLAAHLGTALFTLALTAWTALRAARPPGATAWRRAWPVWAFLPLLSLQLVFGAFVAGLRAGLLFNTFPTMGGVWVPDTVGEAGPFWFDLLNNGSTVQLVHRWLAVLVVLAAGAAAALLWRTGPARPAALALGGAAVLQFHLGVFTVLYFHEAPVLLGALHQAGAVLLLWLAVVAAFRAARPAARAPGPAAATR